jgi:hypothetical protein
LHAVILERNKLVGRRVARLFLSAGATVETFEDPAQLADALPRADVLCADAFDGELVAERVRARNGLRGILWTAEPLRRSIKYLVETVAIDHVLGRKDFESAPRAWEIAMIARRLVEKAGPPPPLGAYLDWGFTQITLEIRMPADRDAAVAQIQGLVAQLQAPKRVGEMFGELAHELIMNAMYGAPVDAHGRPKYAGDRKAEIRLAENERPTVRVASDGTKLAFQIRDPFGGLLRDHVVGGLARGLARGELDRGNGGAGLGITMCHNASSVLIFDVARGRHTEVTALLELDMNLREFRTHAKSLHLWSR